MTASDPCALTHARRRFGLFDMAAALLIFLFSTMLVFRFSLIDFDPHHTGLMYKTALDVSRGQVIFRDTFSQYGALTALLQAAAIRLFGERVSSILLSTAFFYGFDYFLFFLLARRFFDRTTAVLTTAAAVFLAPYFMWDFHPWSSVYALFFLLVTALLVWRAETRRPCLFYALAGLSSALAFWCRQPVGWVCLLATLLCPLALWFLTHRAYPEQKKTRLLSLAAAFGGAGAGVLLFLIPIAAVGAFDAFVKQNFSFTFSLAVSFSERGGVVGMLFYRLFLAPLIEDRLWLAYVWFLLPLLSLTLLALSARRLHRAAHAHDETERATATLRLIFALFAIASWHQYYPVSCHRHWYWAALPSLLSALLLITDLARWLAAKKQWKEGARRGCAALLIVLLLGPGLGYRLYTAVGKVTATARMERFENEHYPDMNGLYLEPAEALHYRETFEDAALLHELFPETNIINVTYNGIYSVVGENFCCYFTDMTTLLPDEYPDLLQAYIDEHRPVVFTDEQPDETYRLWRMPAGETGDPFADQHRLPAGFWLPVELYDRLPAAYR